MYLDFFFVFCCLCGRFEYNSVILTRQSVTEIVIWCCLQATVADLQEAIHRRSK